MQADNLDPIDVKNIEEFFKKEIESRNPDATLKILEPEQKQELPSGCLFREHCKTNKPFWKRIFLLKKRR